MNIELQPCLEHYRQVTLLFQFLTRRITGHAMIARMKEVNEADNKQQQRRLWRRGN